MFHLFKGKMMGKKTGKKASYITYGGKEVREIINSHLMGVAFNGSKKSYYTMIPKAFLPDGAKRSKQVWLKSDLDNAVIKFRAIIAELKGEQEKTVMASVDDVNVYKIHKIDMGLKPVRDEKDIKHNLNKIVKSKDISMKGTGKSAAYIDEHQYIQWLKKELQNPSELAKKTGIDAFNHFNQLVLQEQTSLDELFTNYVNSVRYGKIKDDDEKQKTKKTWDEFCSLIQKTGRYPL